MINKFKYYIGRPDPGRRGDTWLPGNTMNGSPRRMATFCRTLGDQVSRGPEDGFSIKHAEGDYHSSSYDNHRRNADFIREAIDLAPFPK